MQKIFFSKNNNNNNACTRSQTKEQVFTLPVRLHRQSSQELTMDTHGMNQNFCQNKRRKMHINLLV